MRRCVGYFAVVVATLFEVCSGQTGPTQCSYTDGVYECDYTRMTSTSDRPITFNDFSSQPQQLKLLVDGFLPYFGDTRVFDSGFSTSSGMDVTQFDDNYPAVLEVNCGWSGSVFINSGAFLDMEYVQHFKIKNCNVFYVGDDTFEYFQSLDDFVIEGGTIDTFVALTMEGLTVEKHTAATHRFPRVHGKFEIVNAKFTYGVILTGVLTYFTNVSRIVVKNAGVTNLGPNMFENNPYVKLLDLSENLFTSLPNGLFASQLGLSEIKMYDINWECTCEDVWWVRDLPQSNIAIHGDMMCNNVPGTSLRKYYNLYCVDPGPCSGKTGVAVGDKCQSVFSIVAMCFAILAIVAACVALVLIIAIWKEVNDTDNNDPVVIDRLQRRARARWRKAARHIIYNIRKGKQNSGNELEADVTMSIPDETRSHQNRSREFCSIGSSSFMSSLEGYYSYRHLGSADYSMCNSSQDSGYAAIPTTNQNRGGDLGWKYR